MELIDKAAALAEIKKLYNEEIDTYTRNILDMLKSNIDTLEVKEMDLSKYINKYFKGWYVDLTDQGNILHTPDGNAGLMSVKEVAKHFFELGLKAKNK